MLFQECMYAYMHIDIYMDKDNSTFKMGISTIFL